MKQKWKIAFVIVLALTVLLGIQCYAITDSDVQAAVDASSKESVSGNIFIWFLCAIAFM